MKKNVLIAGLILVLQLALAPLYCEASKLTITHEVVDDNGTAAFYIRAPINDTEISLAIEDSEDGRIIKNFFVATYNRGAAANDIIATICSWGELTEDGGVYRMYDFSLNENGQIFYGFTETDDDFKLIFIYCHKGENK